MPPVMLAPPHWPFGRMCEYEYHGFVKELHEHAGKLGWLQGP
jgi:hypothetical protein